MADFLDFLLASPAKSPLPIEITATTTLEDIIAATIDPVPTPDSPETVLNPTSDPVPNSPTKPSQEDDDEAIAAAILAETYTDQPEEPATETRLADSLFDLLGPPPCEKLTPIFTELKAELKQQTVPQTLLRILRPKHSAFHREQQLQYQFNRLEPHHPTEIQQLSSFYKYQAAIIETERYQALHQQATRPQLRDSINSQYDQQLHRVIDRVEVSVSVLQKSTKTQTTSAPTAPGTRRRPTLSKHIVSVMENWYQLNLHHPYPDQNTVRSLALQGDIREEQVRKWFANKRSRSNNVCNQRKMSIRHRHSYSPY